MGFLEENFKHSAHGNNRCQQIHCMNTPFHNKYHNNQQKRRTMDALNTGEIRVRTSYWMIETYVQTRT